MTNQMPQLSNDSLIAMLNTTQQQFEAILSQIDIDASAPTEGEWDARHVLSHIIGVLQRTPVQAGFFLSGETQVPVTFNDPYWLDIYADAPKASFVSALRTVYEGNKAFVNSIAPQDLWKTITLPQFGETPLAVFLMVNYQNHVTEQHVPQLQAFIN